MLTQEQIDKLTEVGFKRWQKGNLDRLYINATQLGLVCTYYNTGNISSAELNGERLSNSEGRRMKNAKTFIDVKTGSLFSDNYTLKVVAYDLYLNTIHGREETND